MRKLGNEEIKQRSFEVLQAVAAVCHEHGLRYSLTGGTLLGAVRHQGFIPWDDDIDIMMPRPDYDRFLQIVSSGDCGFNLYSMELNGSDYWYLFAKACHRNTLLEERGVRRTNVKLGVYVDIFPVDGAGNNYRVAKLRTMLFKVLHGLKVTSNWNGFRRSKLRKWYYEPLRYICYLLSKLLGGKRLDKMIDRFLRSKSYENHRFAGRLVGDFGAKEIMPKALFEKTCKLSFEGQEFTAVADYDAFLSGIYGNYMELPPLRKQVTHHEFDAYWVD